MSVPIVIVHDTYSDWKTTQVSNPYIVDLAGHLATSLVTYICPVSHAGHQLWLYTRINCHNGTIESNGVTNCWSIALLK